MKRNLLLFTLFLSVSFITHISYAQDSDGDGTANNLDQDEDNDGVPDVLDGCSTIDLANTIGIGSPIVNNTTYSLEETDITYTTNNSSVFYGYVAGNQGNAIRVQGPGLSNTQLQMAFTTPIRNVTFKLTDFDDNEDITVNAYDQSNNLISLNATNVPFLGSNVTRSGNTLQGPPTISNCEGDDDASDGTCAAYLYFSGQISRIVFEVTISAPSSLRITQLNYCLRDTDNDGVLDFRDIDSDNDGIPDTVESGGVDTDGDGFVDNVTDNNNNGIPDIYDFQCTNGVSATGYATSLDNDDTNSTSNPNEALGVGDQTYASISPGGTLALEFTDLIPAGNNIVIRHIRQSGSLAISFSIERSDDGVTYSNSQTFSTSFNNTYEVLSYDLIGGDTNFIKITNPSSETLGIDYAKYNFGANSNCGGIDGLQILNLDTDNDGLTNAQDLDSDGDGIFDVIEANQSDTDNDALADGFTDTDSDGFNDNFDGDVGNDGTAENSAAAMILTGADTDSDGVPNSYLDADTDNSEFPNPYDIDTDNDGIPDNVEAQTTIGYIIPNTTITATGLDTAYAGGLTPIDTDGDGTPDCQDTNSDGDANLDIEENGDANTLSGNDADQDGLDDNFDSNNVTFDTNDEVTTGTPADLTASFGDADGDLLSGGDLDYRDLFDTNPPVSASIDFDGIDDYVESLNSNIDGLSQYTISFWMKYNGPVLTGTQEVFVLGQKDLFEITLSEWNAATPQYQGVRSKIFNSGGGFLASGWRFTTEDWVHVAVTVDFNGADTQFEIFRNGYGSGIGTVSGIFNSNSNPFRMGIANGPSGLLNFEGWIDEVRIFDTVLTTDQIQRMVYQEIQNNAGNVQGTVIPKDIEDSATNATVPWSDLITYYPMTSIVDGRLIDQSSGGFDAKLFNITTIIEQTAPMPFVTQANGDWITESTWLHGDVWDIEDLNASAVVPEQSSEPYSIVQISHDVTTSSSHRSIGLFVDSGNTLSVSGENAVTNSWYLQLDGTLDLADDSQLIQTENSDLVTSANGNILRRQEGNTDIYWYNYWSSPVGSLGATSLTDNNSSSNNTNNTPFSLSMLKQADGQNVQFTAPTVFDPPLTNPITLSSYWLFTYQNGQTFFDWVQINENTSILPGMGYTQKGAGAAGTEQQYIFDGKPNNGTILLTSDDVDGDDPSPGESIQDVTLTTTFVGNPYPSALDAREFINDNAGVIGGALYVWEQWDGNDHLLENYQGGYGTINNAATERAYQWNDPSQTISAFARKPTFYIPVAQGFFVEVINDGNNAVLSDTDDVEFNNSQRIFIKESDADGTDSNGSVFFQANDDSATLNATEEQIDNPAANVPMQQMRLELAVSNGNSRSFVLAFSDNTTDGYDYGFDARTIDPEDDDLNSFLGDEKMIIQSFSPITDDKVVDLVFNSTGVFNYKLEMVETNITESQAIYVKDNLTGTYFDLRSGAYNFTSDVSGEDKERFDIVFQDQTLSNNEHELDDLIIFVNNNQHKLFVKGLNDLQVRSLVLTNMLGQSVKTFVEPQNQTLDNGVYVGDLSSGVYLVTLKTKNSGQITKKVILE